MKTGVMNEKGQFLVFVTLAFVLLGLFLGLAIDLGRGYLLKARLSRVVDAATLAAAKALKGQIGFQDEAVKAACEAMLMNGMRVAMTADGTCGSTGETNFILNVNFVNKVVSGGPPMRFVEITGTASIPTTFMRLAKLFASGNFDTLTVSAFAECGPERPVDLMLVLDRSGSMGESDGTGTSKFAAMKTAVSAFLSQNFSPHDSVGMTSFGHRGCGNASGTNFTGDRCIEDQPLGSSISSIQTAVNNLQLSGGTNTMEGLLTAGNAMNAPVNNPARATARHAVILVTDGQPTIARRFSTTECNNSPAGPALPTPPGPWTDEKGCLFEKGGESKDSSSHFLFRRPLAVDPKQRIPELGLDYSLYQSVISWARTTALNEANAIRQLAGGNVVIFVIAVGEPFNPDATARLDANARCLLARMANDPGTIVSASPGDATGSCESVYRTPDGDTHSDLTKNWPCGSGPCIDETQQKGKVFTVDLTGDVKERLREIFEQIAALLKLRLTI